MGLSNAQYEEIMRMYSRRQTENARSLQRRREEVYRAVPEMAELDRAAAQAAVMAVTGSFSDASENSAASERPEDVREKLRGIADRRKALLRAGGFDENALEMQYVCPDCQDTGYTGSDKCHCFIRAAADLIYNSSGLKNIIKTENFSTFSFDYYDDENKDPETGMTPRENMRRVFDSCLEMTQVFDSEKRSLLLYGETGLGKTFLTHCIAAELMKNAFSVLYFSAQELFELLAKETFSRSGSEQQPAEYITDCDLLIIDDLGTELKSSFVASRLFWLLNERMSRGKAMLISTNLSLSRLRDQYSERIFSRLVSHFQLLRLYGQDIRIRKRLMDH